MIKLSLMVLCLGLLAACAVEPKGDAVGKTGAEDGEKTSEDGLAKLWIDSTLVDCVGVGPQTCMRIKRTPEGQWEDFYSRIDGFDYEEGFTYEVILRVTEVLDPPADASSLRYELIEITTQEATEGSAVEESAGTLDRGTLESRAWQLTEFSDPSVAMAPGNEATLEFDSEQARGHGFTGCNQYSASYQSTNRELTFGIGPSTMMACPDAQMAQEGAFLAALGEVASYAVKGDRLSVLNASGEPLMTFEPRPDIALIGTEWVATGINNGRQAVASVLADSEVTAMFSDEGLSGNSGCNQYRASFTTSEEAIDIGPAAGTRKMCGQPEGVMEQEAAFLAALSTVTTYQIDRDRLDLRTAEGSLAASFRARLPAS